MKFTSEQKKEIVRYISSVRQDAEEATNELRDIWEELWQAYQSKQDYSEKADWQSKVFVPKVWMKIERAAGEVKRAMQTKQVFTFAINDEDERLMRSELLTRYLASEDAAELGIVSQQLDQIDQRIKIKEQIKDADEDMFRDALDQTNLTPVYADNCKGAFLLGVGWIKVGWDVTEDRAVFRHVRASNVRVSPEWEPGLTEQPKFLVEDYSQSLADLKAEAKRVNEASGDKTYDLRAINQIKGSGGDPEKRSREIRQQGLNQEGHTNNDLQMWQFWGSIPKRDGSGYLAENVMVIIAEGGTIVRISENPFEHGKIPYIQTTPISYPHRGVCGASLAQPTVKLNYTYNNLWNLFMDNLNFTVNKEKQFNPKHLMDPKSAGTTYPGKQWRHNLPPGQTAIAEVPVTPVQKDLMYALDMIRKDIEESMAVTQLMQGTNDSAQRTLGEIEISNQQAKGFFDVIAKDLEQTSLKPLLEMTYDLYTQFKGFRRRREHYRFKVGGITLMVQIHSQIQKIQQALMMALEAPPLTAMTDVEYLYQRLLALQDMGDAFNSPDGGRPELQLNQKQAIHSRAEDDAAEFVRQYRNGNNPNPEGAAIGLGPGAATGGPVPSIGAA